MLWHLLKPSTHFIEPMAVIIDSQGKAWGDYSQFYINRWFKQMPEHDELYADAVIFDDAQHSMVNDDSWAYRGIERKGDLSEKHEKIAIITNGYFFSCFSDKSPFSLNTFYMPNCHVIDHRGCWRIIKNDCIGI